MSATEGDLNSTPFKCYNCGKLGHMAKDCRAPKKPCEKGKEVIRVVTTITETSTAEKEEISRKEQWRRLWEGASEDKRQEMMKDMGFQND